MKQLKTLYILILLCASFSTIYAQQDTTIIDAPKKSSPLAFSGYSGGMMLHTGYMFSQQFTLTNGENISNEIQLKGAAFGIGGAIRINFGKYFRIGSEGYFTSVSYKKICHGYTSVGWGGALVDFKYDYKKCLFSTGVVVGGGSVKNVLATNQLPLDYKYEDNNISYRKYPFCAVDPYISFEYAFHRRIHLITKLDYLFNVSNPQDDYVQGLRIFVGIMFCH